jgi:hypothetical protein
MWRVKSEARIAVAIEQNKAASTASARTQQIYSLLSGLHGCVGVNRIRGRICATQEVNRGFCHYNFHDRFAVTGTGNAAKLRIGVAAGANQRRIAHSSGQLATNTTGGSGGEELASLVNGYRANGSLVVAAMMRSRVLVFAAA